MENIFLMSLGAFIAKRRKYLKMTQEELAEKLHVSKSAVAKWETNGGLPDRDNLRKLAEVIRVPVNDLYYLIRNDELPEKCPSVNITEDVIALLESHGYIVVRPSDEK